MRVRIPLPALVNAGHGAFPENVSGERDNVLMHPQTTVDRARSLSRQGLIDREVARITGVSIGAVQKWRTERRRVPHASSRVARASDCPRCDGRPLDEPAYSYLLGLYLGDGCLTRGHRDVFALSIACSDAWPGLMTAAKSAMSAVMPASGVFSVHRVGMTEVKSYQALAVPVSAARTGQEAHSQDRARRMAAGHRGAVPRGLRARALPLRWLAGRQPGPREAGLRRALV